MAKPTAKRPRTANSGRSLPVRGRLCAEAAVEVAGVLSPLVLDVSVGVVEVVEFIELAELLEFEEVSAGGVLAEFVVVVSTGVGVVVVVTVGAVLLGFGWSIVAPYGSCVAELPGGAEVVGLCATAARAATNTRAVNRVKNLLFMRQLLRRS
jgi:hypothetical protein